MYRTQVGCVFYLTIPYEVLYDTTSQGYSQFKIWREDYLYTHVDGWWQGSVYCGLLTWGYHVLIVGCKKNNGCWERERGNRRGEGRKKRRKRTNRTRSKVDYIWLSVWDHITIALFCFWKSDSRFRLQWNTLHMGIGNKGIISEAVYLPHNSLVFSDLMS